MKRLKQLSIDLGLEERVAFAGWRTRQELEGIYDHHDVLILPSFQDTGGYVVIEAINKGLSVVCLDQGGPAMLVSLDRGIKVPVQSAVQVIEDLATAISEFATGNAPKDLDCLERGSSDAKVMTAEKLANEVERLYLTILEPRIHGASDYS